jgi:hypothetical protein
MVLGAKAPGRVGRRRIQRHGVGTFGCRPRSSSSSKADSWTGQGAGGAPNPVGPIWLGYYRSENGGASFRSSLVPGYPGDTSASGALAAIRTASSGDPVLAWDADGRLFVGSESSEDPAGTKKGFADVWAARYVNSGGGTVNDGKRFAGRCWWRRARPRR